MKKLQFALAIKVFFFPRQALRVQKLPVRVLV